MRTDIYTYFTQPTGVSELLYSAETWVRLELALETAGPVAIGTRESVVPVLSGKGVLLSPAGEPLEFIMPKGNRLFIAAEAVNRVKVIVEPIPWLEQLLFQVEQGFGGLKGLLGGLFRKAGRRVPGAALPSSTMPQDVRDVRNLPSPPWGKKNK
jgi:hypothetical protein